MSDACCGHGSTFVHIIVAASFLILHSALRFVGS
jgi:hypothetical protein